MKAIIKHLGRPTKAQRPESQLLGSFEENVKASCFLVMAKRDFLKSRSNIWKPIGFYQMRGVEKKEGAKTEMEEKYKTLISET